MELREKVAQLPLSPGVYLYKDAGGRIIYVGKAKSLRLRVRSYFSEDKLGDIKTGTLISEARDVDYILVDNEKEALALENNLIKQYKPRFNILLRDDKTSVHIFPRTSHTGWCTSFTVIFWCRRAKSISLTFIRSPVCNTTFTAVWVRASKV
jgi:excinuclease UvrABC nuclease subunit